MCLAKDPIQASLLGDLSLLGAQQFPLTSWPSLHPVTNTNPLRPDLLPSNISVLGASPPNCPQAKRVLEST